MKFLVGSKSSCLVTRHDLFDYNYITDPYANPPIKMELDTIFYGLYTKSLTYEENFRIYKLLTTARSNDKIIVRPVFNKKDVVYTKSIQIYEKGKRFSGNTPYIRIKFGRRIKFRWALDVKISGHLSRFIDIDYFDLLWWFDPTGFFVSLLPKAVVVDAHIKKDIPHLEFNDALKHVITKYPYKPRVEVNAETGRRTFYLTLDQYFYERPDGKVRFEVRNDTKEKVKQVLGTNNAMSILNSGYNISKAYFSRFLVLDPRKPDPKAKILESAHEAVIARLDEIDSKGKTAAVSYQERRIEINQTLKGKFGQKVEFAYPKTSFVEKFLTKENSP